MQPIPVGSTSKVGWGAAFTAFVAALVTYLTGDQTAQETTSVELAGGGLLLLAITHGFRYLQAIFGIKAAPEPPVVLPSADPADPGAPVDPLAGP